MHSDTTGVIQRFNDAFHRHDPAPIADLVADDCVLENTSPAPDGARFEGRRACVAFWQQIAADRSISFEVEDTIVTGERAIVLWRLRFGVAGESSVRGVNLTRVRDGRIVESLGYVKGAA